MTAAAVQAHDDAAASAEGGETIPAMIVLGRDDTGKPHASWFDASEAKLAYQAAGLMGMRALTVATDELQAFAAQLPHGRVFSSGRAFVPFVKGAVYDALVQHLPPGSEDTMRPVDGEPGSGSDRDGEGEGRSDSDADDATSTWTNVPGEWGTIGVGSLVLAPEANEGDGWFEAIVTEVREGDLFLVTWRDWPSEPGVLRHRWHLALLHPEHDQHGSW